MRLLQLIESRDVFSPADIPHFLTCLTWPCSDDEDVRAEEGCILFGLDTAGFLSKNRLWKMLRKRMV